MQNGLGKLILIATFVSFFVRKSYLSCVPSFEIQEYALDRRKQRCAVETLLGKGLKVLLRFIAWWEENLRGVATTLKIDPHN